MQPGIEGGTLGTPVHLRLTVLIHGRGNDTAFKRFSSYPCVNKSNITVISVLLPLASSLLLFSYTENSDRLFHQFGMTVRIMGMVLGGRTELLVAQ